MKKNPGRKERRAEEHRNRVLQGKIKMKRNENNMKRGKSK